MPITPIMRQFAQYVCVGGLAFGVDIAALFLLTEKVGFHYISSASIAFVLGLATNYILCVAVVFDYRALQNRAHEFVIFSLIGVAGLLLNNLLIFLFTEFLGFYYLVSKAGAAVFILFFNFFLRRLWLFSERKKAQLDSP
ncbi:MAG: putative flippase GtrA [Candidatus Accumulibacter regalis]|jgi:putative flippase GtrA|uniref:GtrA family protein n=2 Tax=unclassified Candidatus Accumulibacter TaxID=2619054 RepID=UPI0025BE662C|nr:GtrA family protein [Candidatus Accumulibacter sp. ACC005]